MPNSLAISLTLSTLLYGLSIYTLASQEALITSLSVKVLAPILNSKKSTLKSPESDICQEVTALENAPTLRPGQQGDKVRILQKLLLKKYGYRQKQVPLDGTYNDGTVAAIKKFQLKNSLSADGIVGPQTWKLLVEQSGCL
ncbi:MULTISPECIES: peptidoglycan-binding domain-containing protein [Moorena]|uniref:Putative peptidoglycan-binding domain-containing protein n=1 Tax=Moorena producens 3L TaxID=489825 RepID=F4XWX3_9CYAN|nr:MULTISPECIES: peptidoglycan-binding domain-containing protein [Moorena]EGJ30858.1 putative peptidoglycan-binding domain-containing protein [Moorena producens 3L]NEP37715.1 peptidoglycan-binding protein [Moorena sp. SIO3B2]NEP64823.1 peptidoglycan-binding protein [Moorena sp. SIO3A5]